MPVDVAQPVLEHMYHAIEGDAPLQERAFQRGGTYHDFFIGSIFGVGVGIDMLNLFYRGYVIHEDIRSICYTIYDRRPHREELAVAADSGEAMRWVDHLVAAAPPSREPSPQAAFLPGWVEQPRSSVAAW